MPRNYKTSKSSIKLQEQPQLTSTELLLLQMQEQLQELKESNKLLAEELKTKQTVKAPPEKPLLVVEDFPSKTKQELLLLLAEGIIKAWIHQGWSGIQSRQQNVFNFLTTTQAQELLKTILDRKE